MIEKELRIVKKLPQIILPEKKNEMFINWYNEDLRFQDDIPKTFERGYLKIENNFFNFYEQTNINKYFTALAKRYNTTFRKIEGFFNEFLELTKDTMIYFEFKGEFLYTEVYLKEKLFNTLNVNLKSVDKTQPNPRVEDAMVEMLSAGKSFQEMYSYDCFVLLQCVLWYLATTTNTTKYKREGKPEPFYYERKEVINPKKNKTITTPIYDMKKIRTVKLDSLIKRRKGWTYSHSFQVHGHYRHYKDGKVIFIEPFIKGKGKEEVSQIITVNPKG